MEGLVRAQGISRRHFVRQLGAFGVTITAAGRTAAAWAASAQDLVLPRRSDSLKFAVISDLHARGDEKEYAVARQMAAVHAKFPFEMVITAGDNINGSPAPAELVSKFEKPFDALLGAGVPFYAALGNHDGASNRFYPAWNMSGQRYYSFARKNARFFVLDSNDLDRPQLAWIDGALRDCQEDWKICVFHHPPYSDGVTHGSQMRVRGLLEPIFVEHGVDVVFTGHDHIYERFKPQNGISWFVTGGAGPVREGDTKPSSATAAYYDREQSFMIVEIQGDGLFFQATSREGRSVDSGASSAAARESGAAIAAG